MRPIRATQTILVVDDNSTNLGVISEYLEEHGFEVMAALDGMDGIEKARMGEPDLILLDVMMPGMDGFETCRCLHADDATRHIPVIFMTALNDVKDKVKGFAAGGVDYITKPLQEEEVLARVRTHLQLQAQQHKLEQQALELEHAKKTAEAAQRAAESANQAKSIFLANMSHELRTPLTAIIGFSQFLIQRRTLAPEDQEDLDIIIHSGEHLLMLINQVLDLSKIEAGRIFLQEKNFDLYRMLADVKNIFTFKAEQQGLRLSFEKPGNLPRHIRTDEVKLRQVLINLLNNAVKFTEKGDVTLKVVDLKQPVEGESPHKSRIANLAFEISDTGPGIAPEELGVLFEPFTQTETGRRAQEGTGLGLPISRRFVQLMGGDISVNSEVGHGSTFSFDIQCDVIDADGLDQAPIPKRAVALEPDQPRYRLLIVDHKPNDRKLLFRLLEPFGFELREALNGQEALEVWAQWKPHLMWVSRRMPVMDGYDMTTRLRTFPDGCNTKIIITSASAFEEERNTALAKGADNFLRKPFHESELFDLLHTHLGVRFVYETQDHQPALDAMSRAEATLTPEALAVLPDDLLGQLRQASESAYLDEMIALIEQVRRQDSCVADALMELARGYRFDLLQQVLEK
jgi:signal transduction histidine kinase